uniref:Si:ch211-13f8.2 n=1 Tax=Sinocyclocheilus rhinocerous TaxID=307959 RepID=A0A673MWC8_9TELE
TLSQCQPIWGQITSLLKPKVVIAVLARNSEHSLPYFLGCIERLDYPKDQDDVEKQNATMANSGPNMDFMYNNTDHNIDNTTAMLHEWLSQMDSHSIYFYNYYVDELGPKHWRESRFSHVMKLRQAALTSARAQWADYILVSFLFADSDNLLTNTQVLNQLIAENRTLVAPMLESRTLYSNFWCGMTSQVQDSSCYNEIFICIRMQETGEVNNQVSWSFVCPPLRHSASAALAFYPVHHYYLWALDDIMAFAFSARQAGLQMFICNKEHYGYLPLPLNTKQKTLEEVESFSHTVTEALSVGIFNLCQCNTLIFPFFKVYLINLKRREDRRDRMLRSLELLGIDVTLTDAVDALNSTQLRALEIEMLSGYKDPYSDHVLIMGEKMVLLRTSFYAHAFLCCVSPSGGGAPATAGEPNFKSRLNSIMEDVKQSGLQWDLMRVHPEHWLEGVKNLVIPDYSYWTLGYVPSLQGAKTLLEAQPLSKMLPVDEFLQVMFNKHHNDTETSSIWDDETVATDWDRLHIRGDLRAQRPSLRAARETNSD